MLAESGGEPRELLALAEQSAAPQLTEPALKDRFGGRSTWVPTSGQLWRAVHENVTALLLVLAVDAESVSAVPVTVEASDVDNTVVLRGNTFGVPITAWAGLRCSLPISVLDRPVDDLGAAAVEQLTGDTSAVGPVADAALSEIQAELSDDLAVLATATAPAAPVVVTMQPLVTDVDLDNLTPEALEEAAVRLHVGLPIVLDLIDGKQPPTPEQAAVLRETVGGVPKTSPPPPGLVVELTQPRWRGLVRQRRRPEHHTEHEARTSLAYEMHAMAARQTGDQEPSWPDRIRRWAEAHHLDVDADA